MITSLLVTGTVLATTASAVTYCRVRARRLEARLRSPELFGVPLPVPDDPRWVFSSNSEDWARLGDSSSGYYFLIDRDGGVWFGGGDQLGYWPAYVKRVFAALDEAELQKRAARALTVIQDSK
jgi:glycine/D-amino acid oxidase-like deaminating enzyme